MPVCLSTRAPVRPSVRILITLMGVKFHICFIIEIWCTYKSLVNGNMSSLTTKNIIVEQDPRPHRLILLITRSGDNTVKVTHYFHAKARKLKESLYIVISKKWTYVV